MIVAQRPPPPDQGVIVQGPRGVILAQIAQVRGEVAGQDQCVGVVVAPKLSNPGQGVLVLCSGGGVVAHLV